MCRASVDGVTFNGGGRHEADRTNKWKAQGLAEVWPNAGTRTSRANEKRAGKNTPSPSRVDRAERSFESEAERGPHEHVVRVDVRTQVGATEDVVPERELGAKVCVPIFTEYGDVLGEQPRDTRPHLHADRGIGVGLV